MLGTKRRSHAVIFFGPVSGLRVPVVEQGTGLSFNCACLVPSTVLMARWKEAGAGKGVINGGAASLGGDGAQSFPASRSGSGVGTVRNSLKSDLGSRSVHHAADPAPRVRQDRAVELPNSAT